MSSQASLEEDDLAILRLGLTGGGRTGQELNANYHAPEPEPLAVGGVRGGFATPGRAVQPHIMFRPKHTSEELAAARGSQPNRNAAANRNPSAGCSEEDEGEVID